MVQPHAGMGPTGYRPSGLFPSGPPRPTFREPHPVRLGPFFGGVAMGAAWLLVFGMLASTAGGYVWLTIVASLVAWACSAALLRFGDRGAAAGIAMASAFGLAVASVVVIERWSTTGWPLW